MDDLGEVFEFVFPVSTGMNRESELTIWRDASVPRKHGDEPQSDMIVLTKMQCSP